MKTQLLLIISLLFLLSGCKTLKKEGEVEGNPINRFENVIGLKKGDTIEKVYEIYGKPNEHRENSDEYSFNTVYYYLEDPNDSSKRALSVSYEKDTHKIYTIRISKYAPLFLRQKGIKDEIYIGMHADKLRKIFGPKEYSSADILKYEGNRLEVDFNCYDFNEYNCYEYCIYWWN